jgi:hypothetical protein
MGCDRDPEKKNGREAGQMEHRSFSDSQIINNIVVIFCGKLINKTTCCLFIYVS